jgi:hypothetical protein
MKKITFYIFTLLTLFTSCEKSSDASIVTVKGFYDYLQVKRDGGGQIYFNLYATENSDKIKALVSKYDFRDTAIVIIIDKNEDNAIYFDDFTKALNNNVQLTGDFTQPTLPTGTWVNYTFITNDKLIEVTNNDLRNSLQKIEQLVQDNIK